jgi:hypothetical protein
MKTKTEWTTIIIEPAEDDDDEFLKMFEAGIPLGDIFWKIQGIVIEPDPETGYEHMFSSPISQLGIPEEILKEKGLLGY